MVIFPIWRTLSIPRNSFYSWRKKRLLLFLLLYSAFFAFGGAIYRKWRYMVAWEKPPSQKVVCQREAGNGDLGNKNEFK